MSDATPRVQPFFCPYCGEQDLRPSATTGWHCRSCDRRFELRFLGLGDGEGARGTEEASRQASVRPPEGEEVAS
jgi:hypothetical protein